MSVKILPANRWWLHALLSLATFKAELECAGGSDETDLDADAGGGAVAASGLLSLASRLRPSSSGRGLKVPTARTKHYINILRGP